MTEGERSEYALALGGPKDGRVRVCPVSLDLRLAVPGTLVAEHGFAGPNVLFPSLAANVPARLVTRPLARLDARLADAAEGRGVPGVQPGDRVDVEWFVPGDVERIRANYIRWRLLAAIGM